jgi:microcystin-dependent protein
MFEEEFGSKNIYGGDGITTFAVPDLRNEFLRGYHSDSEEQLSGEVGAHQDATEHQRVGAYTGNNIVVDLRADYSSIPYDITLNRDTDITNEGTARYWTMTSSKLNSAATTDYEQYYAYTSRPTNVAVLYCIKY